MTRMRRASRTRREATAETTPARSKVAGKETRGRKDEAARYARAFARVRLVRAWIAAVAAIASMVSPYVALLERLLKWWSTLHGRRAPRLAAVLAVSCALGGLVPARMLAHGSGAREAGRPPDRTTPAPFIAVTITHAGNGSASVYTNASGSTSFTVTNTGTTGTALFSVTDCTGAISNCAVSPAASYLQAGWSTGVTVSFTGGMTPGSGSFTLKAHDQSNNSLLATYTVTVTVTADPNAPTVSLTPHLGDWRDVGMCVADCFESTLSYTLPAYTSLDAPRSVTLLYRSGSAYPHGTLSLDASSATAPAGSTFRLQLLDPNGSTVTFSNGAQALHFVRNASGPTRIVAQFDATQIPTSARLYTAYVSTIKTDGSVFGTAAASVRIIVINERNSPYGAGVSLVGIQRIWFNQPDGALVTDGSGSATFFAGSCNVNTTCSFTSPSGEFSTLRTAGAAYYRTYPDSTRLQFYPDGNLYSTVDRFGSTTVVSYQYNGSYSEYVPSAITDPAGQSITFQYRNVDWLYGWKQGSLGNIDTPMGDAPIGIDTSNNAQHWVELCGGTYRWRMTYGAQNLLDTAYDKASSPYKHVYRYGATLAYTDAPAIKIHGVPTATSPRVTLRDAADGLLTGAAAGNGTSASPLAVATDLRALVIGPRNDTTLLSLNRFGAPTKTYVPLTPSDSAEYNSTTGQVTRTISPTGMDVRYTWNADKLIKVQNVTLATQDSIVYASQFSLPVQTISSTSAGRWFTYDQTKTGWPLRYSRIGSSTASPTTFYADARGRDTAIVDPAGHSTKRYYAASGLMNLDSVRAPNTQVTRVSRDSWGRVVSTRDPYGARDSTVFDVINRPVRTFGPLLNDTTRYQYDALNNVTSVTDAEGQIYAYQRNALGWVTKLTHPGALGSDTTAYDIAGNPVYVKTRGNREIELEYDLLGRLRKKRSVASNDSITFLYDPAGRWVQAKSVEGGSTVVSIDTIYFDSLGRTTKEMTDRPGTGYWNVVSQYNTTNGARAEVSVVKGANSGQYSDGFQYDALQRLSHITIQNYLSTRFTYNSDQLRDTVVYSAYYGNPLRETWEYTPDHALARRSYNVTAAQNALHRAYRSDSLGRVGERSVGTTGKFQNFSYDLDGRLEYWIKKHQTGTPTCVNDPSGWGYDCSSSGVLTDSTATMLYDNVENPTDLGAVVDPGNRLRMFNGDSMTYDLDGQLVKRKVGAVTDSLFWDDFGQLKSIKRNGTLWATFNYDGFGRRVRKWTSTNSTVRYVWDGDQIILETNGSGVTTQAYSYQPGTDRLHAVTAGGVTYYASIEPATGTVNGLIRASDNAVVAQYAYTPWGGLEVDSTNIGSSLRWKGLIYDRETALYYMRARYYDPKMRRFISEDPIGLEGGINLYVFAGGDPLNGSDPSGMDPVNNGFNQCWKRDYSNTWGNSEPVMHWVQVECPSSPLPSGPVWEPRAPGLPSVPTGQTTGGGQLDYGRLASTAGKKLLACSDRVVGVALAATGTASFYKAMRLSYGFIQSGRATQALMAVKRSGYQTRQLAWRLHHEQYAAKLAGGSALLGAAGSPSVAFHDAYFFNAEDAAKLVGGFIPFVNVLISVGELGECLVRK